MLILYFSEFFLQYILKGLTFQKLILFFFSKNVISSDNFIAFSSTIIFIYVKDKITNLTTSFKRNYFNIILLFSIINQI